LLKILDLTFKVRQVSLAAMISLRQSRLVSAALLSASYAPLCVAQDCQSGWGPVFDWPHGPRDLAVSAVGGDHALYAGGYSNDPYDRFGRLQEGRWHRVGGGIFGQGNPSAAVLLEADLGSGPLLFVGGEFAKVGQTPALNIAAWNGSAWSVLGAGLPHPVSDLAAFNDGSGTAVYVIGRSSDPVFRWDGVAWTELPFSDGDRAQRLVVHDDGTGPALFAAGTFRNQEGTNSVLARWTGSQWAPAGPPLQCAMDADACNVHAVASFDDGSGPAIYVGGSFSESLVHRWNGTAWSIPAAGIPLVVVCPGGGCYLANSVDEMEVIDDGAGPALYIGGAYHKGWTVAKWDGEWTHLGGSETYGRALAWFDDGEGESLFCGGSSDLDVYFSRLGCPPVFPGVAAFEPSDYKGHPDGLELVQRGWHNDGPADSPPLVYTYGQNAPGLPLNPDGGAQFSAPRTDGPGKSTLARHRIDLSSADTWDLAFDIAPISSGAPPVYPDVARFVLHLAADPGFRVLIDWDDPASPTSWSLRVDAYDPDGARHTFDPGAAFHGLPAGQWVRVSVKLDLHSNRVTELALSEPAGLLIASLHPAAWHLLGGATPKMPRDTFVRLAVASGGNGGPGNLVGWDNVRAEPGTPACAADCNLDGAQDLFDFLCFITQFADEASGADCDASGTFDLFDFLCFVNSFNAGC
jgi:hypothetical protein